MGSQFEVFRSAKPEYTNLVNGALEKAGMMLDDMPQQMAFQWCFRVERVEERPLCRVMWGKDISDARWEVFCYAFTERAPLEKAQQLVGSLAQYPWFESFKAVHFYSHTDDGGILSVARPAGPCLQEVFAQLGMIEQVRLCLELGRAIDVLHRHHITHGCLDGANVVFDPTRRIPVVCQTVCGFYRHQVFVAALPPERRHQHAFIASEKDDVWQFGALFLKRLEQRSPLLTKVIFRCTHPNPERRPEMGWVVGQLNGYIRRQKLWANFARVRLGTWLMRLCGVVLLLLAVWQMKQPNLGSFAPSPREFANSGALTLINEPGTNLKKVNLGDSAADLSAVLGRPIVMADHLRNRPMKQVDWLVWDQMLEEMNLGWRMESSGAIEIFELLPKSKNRAAP